MPSGCNVCNSRIQKLYFMSLILFPTWIVVNDINFGSDKVKALRVHWSELQYLDLHRRSASVSHVVTSVASAVSNCNTHKCSIARRQERSIRSFAMSRLNGILLKQWLGWQLLGERYWCLSVGLEYKSVVMLPSLTVVVVSRKDILVFDTSCVNFIDGWNCWNVRKIHQALYTKL
jgi:hypothetical protein